LRKQKHDPYQTRNVPPRVQWQLEQQGVHPLLARIYAARGIQTKSELDYELKSLIPPAQLTHAADAAVLLADAIEAQARILIVADYDCDGATACAVGVRALRAMAAIPAAKSTIWCPTASPTATACRRRSSTSPPRAARICWSPSTTASPASKVSRAPTSSASRR
jgi:hypothetical protein